LARSKQLSNNLARFYIAEVSVAIQAIHDVGILYRDLKPENIMIDSSGHVKLVDFGLAKIGVRSPFKGASTYVGTPQYLSPEMVKRENHGFALDWWGLGMVLFEMLTGLPPWYCDDNVEISRCIVEEEIDFSITNINWEAQSLIRCLLQKDPQYRLGSQNGLSDIKSHSYFRYLDFGKLATKQIKALFVPTLDGDFDIRYFDNFFTSKPISKLVF